MTPVAGSARIRLMAVVVMRASRRGETDVKEFNREIGGRTKKMAGGRREKDPGQGGSRTRLGFSFAKQFGQRPLDQKLFDRFLFSKFPQRICIHHPAESQLVKKNDFFFHVHGQHSFL
jgi:hypothetical protein